jgi:serine protease SohB
MIQALIVLALFAAKAIIIALMILIVLIVFFALASKNKHKAKGRLIVKNLNEKYAEHAELLLGETLPKKLFKKFLKETKNDTKAREKSSEKSRTAFVLNFHGDIKASAVANLSEEITAVLMVAKPEDEVIVRLESAGGMVHGYGLAAAQLQRIRAQKIPLTIAIDKIAASGGYMMACVADKILAAPFAIIGSIGVIVQLPNFHRAMQDKHIDFEMQTAGEYKRTLTVFGENTNEGREKLQEEIEDIHQQFKNLIKQNRQDINIDKVATGEHWLGQQALGLKLVDEIKTSDDYLLERSKNTKLFEVCYEIKKPSLMSKLSSSANTMREKMMGLNIYG